MRSGDIGRRLSRLEDARRQEEASLGRKALEYLSDEDLYALADALEVGQEDGSATFEDLYRVSTEQSRRATTRWAEGSSQPLHLASLPQALPVGVLAKEGEAAILLIDPSPSVTFVLTYQSHTGGK